MMKKMFLFFVIAGVLVGSVGCGPSYRTQQGAVIGAALGAWAGQDIGHDTESTLIGAAVGGMAGAVIGDAVEQYEADRTYQQQPYTTYNAPYQNPPRRY